MQPQSQSDYKQLLTDVIKKQIVILGPDITLSKARNVKGLTVSDDGTVTNVSGSPQEVTQALIDQFVQLSGLIVKKTMEPLLSIAQATAPLPVVPQIPIPPVTPTLSTPESTATPQATLPPSEPLQPQMTTQQAAQPPQAEASNNPVGNPVAQPASPDQPNTNPSPANNPLAA